MSKKKKVTPSFGTMALKTGKPLDLVIIFDTTGSMNPCIDQLRKNLGDLAKDLWGNVKNLRVGVISHGDYCDENYCESAVQKTDLTKDPAVIDKAIREAKGTGGGDSAEMYERVLHEVRGFSWRKTANKIVIMFGDDVPHDQNYAKAYNKEGYDWQVEAKALADAGIQVNAVKCLNATYSEYFWTGLAKIGNGTYMKLAQFGNFENVLENVAMAAIFSSSGSKGTTDYLNKKMAEGKISDESICYLSSNVASYSKGDVSYDEGTKTFVPKITVEVKK